MVALVLKLNGYGFRSILINCPMKSAATSVKNSNGKGSAGLDLLGTAEGCWVSWWKERHQTWIPAMSSGSLWSHRAAPDERARNRVETIWSPVRWKNWQPKIVFRIFSLSPSIRFGSLRWKLSRQLHRSQRQRFHWTLLAPLGCRNHLRTKQFQI